LPKGGIGRDWEGLKGEECACSTERKLKIFVNINRFLMLF